MTNPFFIAALFFMLCVVGSLIGGMMAMGKDSKKSQLMMRRRVLFQGLALICLLLAYLTRNHT